MTLTINNIWTVSESYTRQYYGFLICNINRCLAIQGTNKFCTASLILHLYFPCQFSKKHIYLIFKTSFKNNWRTYFIFFFLGEKNELRKLTWLTQIRVGWFLPSLLYSFISLITYPGCLWDAGLWVNCFRNYSSRTQNFRQEKAPRATGTWHHPTTERTGFPWKVFCHRVLWQRSYSF